MKRKLKNLLFMLIISALVLSVFGCGSGSKDVKDNDDSGSSKNEFLFLDPNKYEGKTIYVFTGDGKSDEDAYKDVSEEDQKFDKLSPLGRKKFEDATKTTIKKVSMVSGEDYKNKLITMISAGLTLDLIQLQADSGAMPKYILKNLILPLSDYIDFNKPEYQGTKRISQQVKNYYTWGGKVYGMYWDLNNGDRLFYNKEKFTNAGLEDPLELWKEDKWTWEEFFEAGQALSQDTDGDGVIDQWGHISWFFDTGFISSNGVEYVTYDESGMPKFALDEKFIQAKQAADDTINKYKMTPSVWWDPVPQERFYNGESAMDYWGYWEMQLMYERMGDKFGIVPFPRGPSLSPDIKSRNTSNIMGWGLSYTSGDPELAALYLEWLFEPDPEAEANKKPDPQLEWYGSQEMVDLAMQWSREAAILDMTGYGDGFKDALNLILNKPADKSWQQALDENRAACQKALDDAIVNMKN